MRHSIQLNCGFHFTFCGEHGEHADLREALIAWVMKSAQPSAAMVAVLTELAVAAKDAAPTVRQVVQHCTAYRREKLLRLAEEEVSRRAALSELNREAARHALAERQRRLMEPVAPRPTVTPAKAAVPVECGASAQAKPAIPSAKPIKIAPAIKSAAPVSSMADTLPAGSFATPELVALKASLVTAEQARQRLERTRAYGTRIQRHRHAA
ncbi:MAG: hypothetical protein LM522_12405 [Candidatus Contendobacter sp.]|nr:hypothetical protein [Candidatus Contendobacter sp.]